MTQVRIQEYLRYEKYYLIPTRSQGEYLAISYDKKSRIFILQYFRENKNIIGGLEPHIYKRFEISEQEINLLNRTMTLIWNSGQTSNFNIMENLIQKIDMRLLCKTISHDKRCLYLKLIAKPEISYLHSFSVLLTRNQCRQLYSVIRHIKAENKLA